MLTRIYRHAVAFAAAALVIGGSLEAVAGVHLLSKSSMANVTIIDEGVGSLAGGSLALDYSTGASEIGPGVRFESFLIKIDDFSACSIHAYDATFGIDGTVLGIQTDAGTLRSGRRTLAANGFTPGAPAGGLEGDDMVSLNGNLLVSGYIGGNRGVDPIRVFIEATAVPELASLGVWSTISVVGLLSCGRLRRR